ncbi:TIGR03560 family F420-dependent LLM class oxidoreductase [Halobacteriales archaeon Cl-PHB]
MEFGYHHHSFYSEGDSPVFDSVAERVRYLDAAGFDWVSCMDHLWQIGINGYADEPFFDAYTTLPALAAWTDSVELSALVTCPFYRNPALLGRTLTTLDHISDGRAVLGIGAGWADHEFAAYGYDFPETPERIARMVDTIQLVKAMWTQESPVTYRGEFYEIEELVLEPKPVRDPHPPILIGGGGEQLTLRAVAEHADRWNIPSTGPEEYDHKLSVLRDHCETVGRDYDEIDKTVVHWVVIDDTTEAAHRRYDRLQADTEAGPTPRGEDRGLVGTADDVIEGLETYRDLGVDMFVVKPPKGDDETVERFVEDVMPSF